MPVVASAPLTLHFAPRTRSLTALWALEELGIEHRLEVVDFAAGQQRSEAYRTQVNPMGKVPAVVDASFDPPATCAETGAILVWLGDRYGLETGLAVGPDARVRADYLRWLFFSGSIMEPALGEVFFKWEVPSASVSWGSFARMTQALEAGLADGPWLLGERFTLADVAVGATARFGVAFGAIPNEGAIGAYVARLQARPALQRALAIEASHLPTDAEG